MSMSQSPRSRIVQLPYIDIQHDALAVFDDVEQGIVHHEDIWVSGYKRGETSVHGKARVEAEDGGRSSLTARDGVKLERRSKTTFIVSVHALGVESLSIQFARQIIRPPYAKHSDLDAPLHINSLALNPKSQHVVLGGPDGYAVILPIGPEANVEKDVIRLKGHVGDVRDVKWFPSGEVILTASSDLSLRIFGKDGINPRTFRGHTRALTSTAILGVGKQVLSGSKDGTIRLWDVSKALEERRWLIGGDRRRGVEDFVVIEDKDNLQQLGLEKEETALLVVTQDGLWIQPWSQEGEGWLIPNEDIGVQAQLVCFAFDQQTGLVVTGHSDGIVALRHVSSLTKPLPQIAEVDEAISAVNTTKTDQQTPNIVLIRRNEASIYSLAFGPPPSEEANSEGISLYVGTAAGLPARLGVKRIQGEGERGEWDVRVVEEYAGWEAVGIETWGVGKDGVWCAGGEGGLRKYTI